MNINLVVLAGNLTKDPELRYTPNGTAKCRFTVAVNRYYKDSDGNRQDETQFIPVIVWGSQAENVKNYLVKGNSVIIEGRLVIDKFQGQDGQNVTYPYVVARLVQFGPKPNGKPKEDKPAETPAPEKIDEFPDDGPPF